MDNQIEQQKIFPQNFGQAILIGILVIITSISVKFFKTGSLEYTILVSILAISSVGLLLHIQKYLKNYNAHSAIMWINWLIVFNLTQLLAVFTGEILLSDTPPHYVGTLYLIFTIILAAASVVVYIIAGIALQKIKNDLVGHLKIYGMSFSYVIPVLYILTLVAGFTQNELLSIITVIVGSIPTFIIIIIFNRARKYVTPK
jgi:hypothetical protein